MNDFVVIDLNGGLSAMVDQSDAPSISKLKWSSLTTGGLTYARRTVRIGGKQKTILLHREIMKPGIGQVVDHINGNGLDCRRSNMRLVTRQQNNINKRTRKDSRTGEKGVRKHTLCNRYTAEIKPPGSKRIYLGIFATIEEASQAYQQASEIHHGEFRRSI